MVQEDWLDDYEPEHLPPLEASDSEDDFDEPRQTDDSASEDEPTTHQPTLLPWVEAAFSGSQRSLWQAAEKHAGLNVSDSLTKNRRAK